MYRALKNLAKWIVPHNIWTALRQRGLDAARRRTLNGNAPETSDFSCDAAIEFLETLGCDRGQVTAGSMPRESLDYTRTFLPAGSRRGLHVGNFVGVSLAFFINALGRAESAMVAIDPNVAHRGISNPASMVIALLAHFGLEENCLLLTGYSLERNVANDGRNYPDGDFETDAFSVEPSCAQVLPQLSRLAEGIFDFAVVDGNHDGTYLRREIAIIAKLLKVGGILILDDVSSTWFEIERVYGDLNPDIFTKLGTDGRVGILRKRADARLAC